MMRRIMVGRTLTASGVIVSTVGLFGVALEWQGGPYETCLFSADGDNQVVQRYRELERAIFGHLSYVHALDGEASWWRKAAWGFR